jgi:DnaJ-class molecular chaperone
MTLLQLNGPDAHCREGDAVTPGVPPGPLVLVLASAPHPVFSRRGACDLKAKVKLPLLTALVGGSVRLDTLDGR